MAAVALATARALYDGFEPCGVYIRTDADVDADALLAAALACDDDDTRPLARAVELAYQADVPALLDALAARPLRLAHVLCAQAGAPLAFAYSAVRCLHWIAQWLPTMLSSAAWTQCVDTWLASVHWTAETRTEPSFSALLVLHYEAEIPADALLRLCLVHGWTGWLPHVLDLGAAFTYHHLYGVTYTREVLEAALRVGLLEAIERSGDMEDYKYLVRLLTYL